MPKPQVNLAELAQAGGGTRRRDVSQTTAAAQPEELAQHHIKQKSRENTVPITVQQPEDVRLQLKMLALEQRDTLENKVAESLNDLFAKYGKPEIAVIKKRKGRAA
jgi:hypothetical protein